MAIDDFERQQLDIMQRRKRAQEGQQFNTMPGQMVSGHYVAPHFTQVLAEGLRGYSDIKGEKQADQELKDLTGKRNQAMTDALRGFTTNMTPVPEQRTPIQADAFDEADRASLGGNQNLTAVTPERKANPMAANMALMNAPDPQLQRTGMQNLMTMQQRQAAQAQAQAERQRMTDLWKQSGGNPQAFLEAGGELDFAQNMMTGKSLGTPTVVRTVDTVDERGRPVTQGYDANNNPVGPAIPKYVAPKAPKSPNVIANGTMILGPDNVARPIMGADGKPLASNAGQKPLPAHALKAVNEVRSVIGTAQSINADLSALEKQITDKKLSFGPISNLVNQGLNMAGQSTPESRNFSSFKSSLERLRNESLRLNAGVQTDGDAQRAWNELFSNITDTDLVQQRLGEIKRINERAVNLQKLTADSVLANYGQTFDATPYENMTPALGGGDQSAKTIVRTGTVNGRKVVQYSDGTTEYAD
jgi:hypothetical protein